MSSRPPDSNIHTRVSITCLLHRSTIGLHETYILINFDILDALVRSLLWSKVITISFNDGRGISASIYAPLHPSSVEFTIYTQFDLWNVCGGQQLWSRWLTQLLFSIFRWHDYAILRSNTKFNPRYQRI